MRNFKIDQKISNLEKQLGTNQNAKVLKSEYKEWIRKNPLGESPGFDFYKWLDDMPIEFVPFFTENFLNVFPWLKQSYRG